MPYNNIIHYFGVYLEIILTEDNVSMADIAGDAWKNNHFLGVQNPTLYPRKIVLMGSEENTWLYLTEFYAVEPYVKEFPAANEIKKMKAEFMKNHKEILSRIAGSDLVKNFSVKAGYVADEEYYNE